MSELLASFYDSCGNTPEQHSRPIQISISTRIRKGKGFSFFKATDSSHCRFQIVTLIEVIFMYHLSVVALRADIYPSLKIARATLLKMDIKLYTFSPCNLQLRPYKTIYLDILRALKERQNDVSDSVRKGNSTHFQGPHYSRSTTSLIHLLRPYRHFIAALLCVASG